MLISEITFPHLVAANDDRIARDLERRRVALERNAEAAEAAAIEARAAATVVPPTAATGQAAHHAASRSRQTNRMPRPAA